MAQTHVRAKKTSLPRIPKLNAVAYATELSREMGLDKAFSLAKDLAEGSKKALDGAEGRHIMDYMTRDEVRKSHGFWSSVAGFLNRKLENAGSRTRS